MDSSDLERGTTVTRNYPTDSSSSDPSPPSDFPSPQPPCNPGCPHSLPHAHPRMPHFHSTSRMYTLRNKMILSAWPGCGQLGYESTFPRGPNSGLGDSVSAVFVSKVFGSVQQLTLDTRVRSYSWSGRPYRYSTALIRQQCVRPIKGRKEV